MKKKLRFPIFLLLAIITSLPQQSNAQYFAPVGAKWTYTYSLNGFGNPPPYTIESLTIEVTKDTNINNITCRELEIIIPSPLNTLQKYIRSINDSVLIYSPVNNKFNLLYDFTANIGDTLMIYYDDFDLGSLIDSALVEVDSVGFKNVKGISYRAYHQKCLVNVSNCPERSTGWIIDSLGMIEYGDRFSYLFPAMNIAGSVIGSLRCYTDNNTFYNYDNTNCDSSYVITSVNDISNTKINIYPTLIGSNNRTITIESANDFPKQIKLVTLTGISIPTNSTQQQNKIELTINKNIPSGIYLLKFQLNNIPFTKRIIKL